MTNAQLLKSTWFRKVTLGAAHEAPLRRSANTVQAGPIIWSNWWFGVAGYPLSLGTTTYSTSVSSINFGAKTYNLIAAAVVFDRLVGSSADDWALEVSPPIFSQAVGSVSLTYIPHGGAGIALGTEIFAHEVGATGLVYLPASEQPGAIPCSYDFSNYPAFRRAFQQLIDGDDVSPSNISPQTLDLFISMGERRVYRDVRSSAQDTLMTLTVVGNSAPLPIDCIELRSVYFPTRVPLRYMAYEQLQARLQIEQQVSTHPVWYSFEGDNLIFYPTQADGTVILGRYYKRFCSIVTEGLEGNTYFERYPDLWLYASLMESAPFIGEVTRLPQWQQTYLSIAEAAGEYETRRYTRGSKLQTRLY